MCAYMIHATCYMLAYLWGGGVYDTVLRARLKYATCYMLAYLETLAVQTPATTKVRGSHQSCWQPDRVLAPPHLTSHIHQR